MEMLISDIMIISLHDSKQLALINGVYVLLYSINVRKNPFQLKSKSTPKKIMKISRLAKDKHERFDYTFDWNEIVSKQYMLQRNLHYDR